MQIRNEFTKDNLTLSMLTESRRVRVTWDEVSSPTASITEISSATLFNFVIFVCLAERGA